MWSDGDGDDDGGCFNSGTGLGCVVCGLMMAVSIVEQGWAVLCVV